MIKKILKKITKCKWKLPKIKSKGFKTGCNAYQLRYANQLYCPYCGRKIKIIK